MWFAIAASSPFSLKHLSSTTTSLRSFRFVEPPPIEIEIRRAHHSSNRVLVFGAANPAVDRQSFGIEQLGLVKSPLDLV